MKIKYFAWFVVFVIVFTSCNYEFNCEDLAIYPTFLGFDSSDIDTIVIRKYEPNNNYQNLIDTFIATSANSVYSGSPDSVTLFVDYYSQQKDIKADYDWQIFIPSKQKTVLISDIKSEKKTGERSRFLEPVNSDCFNRFFSAKVNRQLVDFSNSPPYVIYIDN